MKGQTAGPKEGPDDLTGLRQEGLTETSKDRDLIIPVDKSKPDPISSPKRKIQKWKRKKNQTKEKQKDKNAMAMVPYEGTTRDGSVVNLDNTKSTTHQRIWDTD